MHKINHSIDNFYKNSLKKESFQLFLIKENWALLTSPEIAKFSSPYKITQQGDINTLIIHTQAASLASSMLYSQEQLYQSIYDLSKLKISKLKFIAI
ncbi:MAG: DUF721 domain-containing protein [Rickettsiales bacterium]|jgi:hypothetical protein|nr:DUF721 domain-containing protein [Rickettsiales bacterium]